MHSVSTRVSLAWDEEPPFEDSEVLVIVGKKYYVDIRLKRVPENDCVIDWAMAGIKEWLNTEADPPKARFTPILTTRSELQNADEGTFSTLDNGDILETGEMLDPNTGRVRRYSEIWRDLPINKGSVFILEGIGTSDAPTIQRAWLAKMGNYQAAVAKISEDKFLAWTAEKVAGRPGWDVTKFAGPVDAATIVLPIEDPSPLWGVGTLFEANGITWLVKEAFMT